MDVNHWQEFLGEFRKLHLPRTVKPAPATTLSAELFARFFSDFRRKLRDHYENGHGINVWEVAGLGRDEVRNSAVLAWLLDCHGSHGKGSIFLDALLSELRQRTDVPALARRKLPTLAELENYRTRVESLPLGEMVSRVDIEIEGAAALFIEVKIRASETNNQLKRYLELAKHKSGKTGKWAVLFLTTKKSRPIDPSLHDEVISVSWQEVATIIGRNLTGNCLGDAIIRQFCRHIQYL